VKMLRRLLLEGRRLLHPGQAQAILSSARSGVDVIHSLVSCCVDKIRLHRSHFGSRYKLGCCACAGLLISDRSCVG